MINMRCNHAGYCYTPDVAFSATSKSLGVLDMILHGLYYSIAHTQLFRVLGLVVGPIVYTAIHLVGLPLEKLKLKDFPRYSLHTSAYMKAI